MRNRGIWILLGVLLLLTLTTAVAWAAPLVQEGDETAADALWVTLAPIVAIATFVERVLEVTWDRWERAGAWPNKQGVPDKSVPDYVSKKKLWSQWLGTGIAVIAVGLTNVRFFRLLGLEVLFSSPQLTLFSLNVGGIFDDFTVGTLIDWLATAGIIGWGGTELTHSVIEGLVKGRNLWKEMREVEAGRKSILDAKFFTDFIAPRLEQHGVSVAALRQTFQTLAAVGVSPDQFIGQMSTGRLDVMLGRLEAQPEKAVAVQAVRTLLDGLPPEQQAEIPNVLNLLTPEQRQRFLGA